MGYLLILEFLQDTGNYYGVDLSKMSRKQLSHWLVDVANEGSLRLTPAAFQKDGSFFLETSEDVWAESLFGCTRDKCGYVLDKIRSELERNEPSELDVDLLKKTFSASYMDPLNVVGQFISYVEECGERYRKFPGTFFAPYIALFQSSGSGKSRLLREVSRLRSTLYVCCRSGNSGYPLRTSTALQFLFGPLKSKTHEEGLKEMVERLRCAETAARYYLPRAASFPEYDASQAEFPSEQLSNRIWGVDVERSKTKFGVDLDSNSDDAVLIVLDEARWLLDTRASGKWFDANAFRFFRRAIRSYWGKYPDSRLFAVFVDTSSRINNFAPSQAMDPSARQSKEGGGELFRPFILSESFDAYFNQYKLPKGTRDLTPLMTSKNHLFAGRPLVAIPFSDPESHLDFLVRKLYGGGKARLSENTLGALSVVLCRLATSVNNLSPTAAELVAGHMVYLLATDWQREEMSVSHLAEPRLALAAAREWSNEDVLIDLLIPALRGALLSGKVNPGLRGEIVAQIVILLAFDKACVLAGKAKGDVVSLVSVLEQLLPVDSNIDVHEAIPPSLHDASVSCGQFVQLDHYFDLDTNVRLAERHCGASFKGWQPGVDLVITILAKFAALLLFQVKNNYDQDKPCKASYDCANSMMPSNALSGRRISGTELRALDENCVRVYMQVGAKEGPAFCGHGPVSAGAAKPLQIFGLSSRCLTKKQKRSLEILLDATGSLESKFWEQKSQLNTLKRKHPFPNDIATLRLCMPFVLDQSPHWSDYTRKVLLSVCRKLGRRGVSNLSKHAIVTILESEQPGKCVELCEGSPHLISQLEDSIEDDLADASVAGVASSMSDAELTQPAASPKDSVLVNLGQLDRLSVAELKELCKKLGGSKYSRLRKTDLIQKLTQEWPAILRSNDGLQS